MDPGEAEMGCNKGYFHEVYVKGSVPKVHFLSKIRDQSEIEGWKQVTRPTMTVSTEAGRGLAIVIK